MKLRNTSAFDLVNFCVCISGLHPLEHYLNFLAHVGKENLTFNYQLRTTIIC